MSSAVLLVMVVLPGSLLLTPSSELSLYLGAILGQGSR